MARAEVNRDDPAATMFDPKPDGYVTRVDEPNAVHDTKREHDHERERATVANERQGTPVIAK